MKINSGDFRVGEGDKVDLGKWPTNVEPVCNSKKHYKELLEEHVEKLSALQQLHYASNRYAVLLIFQAMDAAGKDGAIRHVMSGVNPQGCQVFSFKHPSATELLHDFLWRTTRDLPERITVAMDWTEFDADGQATIMLSLLSRHGRATPLVWLTVDKAALKNRRNGYEYQVLVRLAEILPAEVRVRIVADRGFGDHKLYRVLSEELKFDFVIRFRGNIAVTATDGEARAAADWVGAGGRARTLRGAAVTAQAYPVATVVCVRAKGMKEPWCLAASTADEPARVDGQDRHF